MEPNKLDIDAIIALAKYGRAYPPIRPQPPQPDPTDYRGLEYTPINPELLKTIPKAPEV